MLSPSAAQWRYNQIDLYVAPDATNANDGNDGSEDSPLASIAGALAKLPVIRSAPVIVHLASSDAYNAKDFNKGIPGIAMTADASVYFWCDGAGQPNDDGFVLAAGGATSGTTQGGTTAFTVVTTGGLTVNALAGKTIRILSGALAGSYRTIASNTAANIVPVVPFTNSARVFTTPGVGVSYEVVSPGAVFQNDIDAGYTQSTVLLSLQQSPQFPFNYVAQINPSLVFINIELTGTTFDSNYVFGGNCVFFGVYQSNGAWCGLGGSVYIGCPQVPGQSSTYPSSNLTVLSPIAQIVKSNPLSPMWEWEGWGWGGPTNGAAAQATDIEIENATGFVEGLHLDYLYLTDCEIELAGVCVEYGVITREVDCNINSINNQTTTPNIVGRNAASSALTVGKGSAVQLVATDVSGATGIVTASDGNVIVSADSTVTGSVRSIDTRNGGCVSWDNGATLSGDTIVSYGSFVLPVGIAGAVSAVASTQAVAAYTAAGVGFTSGLSTIIRRS